MKAQAASRRRAGLARVDWSRWTVILLKPDCLERGLVEPVLTRCTQEIQIVAWETITVTQAQIFAHYHDLLADPARFLPVSVAADLRRCYVGNRVVIALGYATPTDPGSSDTPSRLRAMLGHYDPARAAPESIRGEFGIDSLTQARGEGRLVNNLIHTSDDADAARRDFVIWFGVDRTDLLTTP